MTEKSNATLRPQILLDCDGVLADWTRYLLGLLAIPELTIEDCDEFELFNVLERKAPHAVGHAEELCDRPEFTRDQPVLPGAVRLVAAAQKVGDLTISTSPRRMPGWYDERIGWLYREFGIKRAQVMVGRRKYLLRADVLVDDKPSNIIEWCQTHPQGQGYLCAQPYNRIYGSLPANAERLETDAISARLEGMV